MPTPSGLALKALSKPIADDIQFLLLVLFSQKINHGISCELSAFQKKYNHNCSRRFFSGENKTRHFCLADNSHEMPSFIFCENSTKISIKFTKKLHVTFNVKKWTFLHVGQ